MILINFQSFKRKQEIVFNIKALLNEKVNIPTTLIQKLQIMKP